MSTKAKSGSAIGRHRAERAPFVAPHERLIDASVGIALKGLRSARLLFHRDQHVHRPVQETADPVHPAPRRRQDRPSPRPRHPQRAVVREQAGRRTTPRQERLNVQETINQRSAWTMLRSDETMVNYRQPLLSGEEVMAWTNLNLGPLQAAIHPPEGMPTLYCFDQSTVGGDGEKTGRYLFATSDQLQDMQNAAHEGRPAADAPFVLVAGQKKLIGAEHPLPGSYVSTHRMLRDDDTGTALPAYRGNMGVYVDNDTQNLHIEDLTSTTGTIVAYNPAMTPGVDPYAAAQQAEIAARDQMLAEADHWFRNNPPVVP